MTIARACVCVCVCLVARRTSASRGVRHRRTRSRAHRPAFGLSISSCDTVDVPGYEAPIPRVLLTMQLYLIKSGAYNIEGLFRLAPDAKEAQTVKVRYHVYNLLNGFAFIPSSRVFQKELDEGRFSSCRDPNCVSNCMKAFFRELPESLLNDEVLEVAVTFDDPQQVYEKTLNMLEQPNRSLFEWLVDLCVDVSDPKYPNKMSAKNLASMYCRLLVALHFDPSEHFVGHSCVCSKSFPVK